MPWIPPLPIRREHCQSLPLSPHWTDERSDGTGGSTLGNSSPSQPEINLPPDLFAKPIQPPASQLPNGYPRKSALSLEIEDHESSSSSDNQTADPFNPDSAVSDNEDDDRNDERSRRSFASPTDHHPRDPVGSAPLPAPSEDGSTSVPPLKNPSKQLSTTEVGESNTAQGSSPSLVQPGGYKSPENDGNTSSSSRADKERKPPPPPRSHHGKRINSSNSTSRPESSRSANRLSFRASSPESVTSIQPQSTPNANAGSPPSASDYFQMPSDTQQTSGSTDSLQHSHSQSKRPPTPPLSRRHSQMRRSKSTQSKSSNSRLTMSSIDSESNDSSQPPSPGPSTLSVASSMSQDRKRVSIPPAATPGETRAAAAGAAALPASGTPADSFSPPPPPPPPPSSRPTPLQPGRRTSSYGSPATGSSSGAPPPPPPPRRARDSMLRASDGGAEPQANRAEAPLPQPSHATDILADLSRLQKEVDDLRGHYESRKVSQ